MEGNKQYWIFRKTSNSYISVVRKLLEEFYDRKNLNEKIDIDFWISNYFPKLINPYIIKKKIKLIFINFKLKIWKYYKIIKEKFNKCCTF